MCFQVLSITSAVFLGVSKPLVGTDCTGTLSESVSAVLLSHRKQVDRPSLVVILIPCDPFLHATGGKKTGLVYSLYSVAVAPSAG